MITVKKMVFNAFQENTFLVWDETRECVIIDPGCEGSAEQNELTEFINNNDLKLVGHLYTHCHIDHILGNAYVFETYGLRPVMHRDSLPVFHSAGDHGKMFGIEVDGLIEPETFLKEGDEVKFGNHALEVLHTPGHVNGHICFANRDEKFVIVGDVLFRDSIGRTDLPTGDFDLLSHNIQNKLYTLGRDFTVHPGHGPSTTIGYEMLNNPFVKG